MNTAIFTDETFSLTTENLHLVPMTSKHWSEFKTLQADPSLMAFIGDVLPENELREKFTLRSQPWQAEESLWCSLLIYTKSAGDFVGSVGFRFDNKHCQRVELGYSSLPGFQGKGYITEAGAAMIDFLFQQVKVRKIIACCTTNNIASWKVMEKLNLQREGLLKSDSYINNIWYDSYLYGLVNPTLLAQ